MASKAKPAAQPTRMSSRTKATAPSQTPATTAARTTRAKAAAATTKAVAPPEPSTTSAKKTTRKPLLSRDNSVETKPPAKKGTGFPKPAKTLTKIAEGGSSASNTDREPIMAYLRIRPNLGIEESTSSPYLEPLSDTVVRMTYPNNDSSNPSRPRYRVSAVAPSSLYTFSHIFPPATQQSDFFTKTTLPLVRDLLEGQNALCFTYGVTNSGKTYTVQGGTREGSAGILPRTLDVIFNSTEGMHSDGRYQPVRLQGIELADAAETVTPKLDLDPTDEPALAEVLAEHLSDSNVEIDIDPTVLKLDRNHEYSIWLSYAEVYNEKVYDLLDSVNNENGAKTTKSGLPRPALPNQAHPLLLTRKALPVRPSPASDAYDSGTATSNGKYIAGLRQFRVNSASEAKSLVKLGQLHRRVFGTLANSQSSRSHGLVTIKVVRGHRGERDDPTSLQVSRLTLVDLAGSERTKHTHTTGDRLKEAGSINKSLMVLGQCMEVMRANQRRVAQSLGGAARTDTRDVKRGLAVVPFRHSKLTEVLMDYFIGDGRAVMIVNVNPYDTGFDENSHVMKFAALAREVYTTPAQAPVQRIPPSPTKPSHGAKTIQSAPGRHGEFAPVRRQVTISTGGPGRKFSQAHLEVLEEDEEMGDPEEDDDEPINPLVDALFDEVEELRMQLFESEMRCAIIEAETREEVMKEMEERMRSVEKMYTRRLMNEVERNEMKTDAKIDMLHQSGLFGKGPSKMKARQSDITEDMEEEEEVELSMSTQYYDDDGKSHELAFDDEAISGEDTSATDTSRSPSPLAGKTKNFKQHREIRQSVPDGPECLPLPSECSEEDPVDSEDEEGTDIFSQTTESAENLEDEDESGEDQSDEEEWTPPLAPTSNSRTSKVITSQISSTSSLGPSKTQTTTKARPSKTQVSKLEKDMKGLSLHEESDSDLSAYILPNKKARRVAAIDEDEVEADQLATIKKKKRQVGKKMGIAEDVEQTPIVKKSRESRRSTRNGS